MAEEVKIKWEEAYRIANSFISMISDTCEKIMIAGSLRRRKPYVGDIEIVAKPKLAFQINLVGDFIPSENDLLHKRIISLLNAGIVKLGKPNPGHKRPPLGPRYYRLLYPCPEIQIDLFVVRPPADWGVILAIRTGPSEYAKYLVTKARKMGLRVKDGQLWNEKTGFPIYCPEEEDFFRALNEKYVSPELRDMYFRTYIKKDL